MSDCKVFATDTRGYVLMGDSRDIAVAYNKRQEVWDWCHENKITPEYQGTMAGTDLWRIRDEQERVWFSLRWA